METITPNPLGLVTSKQLQEILGISHEYLDTLKQKEGLPYRRIGKKDMYNLDMVLEWFKATSRNYPVKVKYVNS